MKDSTVMWLFLGVLSLSGGIALAVESQAEPPNRNRPRYETYERIAWSWAEDNFPESEVWISCAPEGICAIKIDGMMTSMRCTSWEEGCVRP